MKKLRLMRLLTTLLIVALLLTLCGCYNAREKAYYANSDNFITDTATVEKLEYNPNEGYLILWLTDINEVYSDSTFVVRGDNAAVLIENGVLDKVGVGDKITYISAPGCYSNGYMFPIVGLSVNGEELLSFDTGHENLMEEY